ncbi:hypothetical protein [Comamonas sp. 17RB]|uniref:hypothetical protein n=1 Tax=Comamonas sp. 17RB TaxID=3047025 RepID=UPI0024B75E05|nr:hypothetical protein [Comamonas sp. 17RB]MDI9855216.1 hypothetical protein [Comamonas sp. 17RB]
MEQRIVKLEEAIAALPTKADIAALPSKTEFADLRADIANSRVDVHKAITDNHRWTHNSLVAILSVGVIGILGLLFTIYNTNKSVPAPQPQVPATIVLQVPAQAPAIQAPAAQPATPGASPQTPAAPQ